MNRTGTIILSLLVCVALAGSCAKIKYLPYQLPNELPRKVFVEDLVNSLNTNGPISSRITFVEVKTRDGNQEEGKLLKITEENLIMSIGYQYSIQGDSTAIIEHEVTIPKNDIIILKVW